MTNPQKDDEISKIFSHPDLITKALEKGIRAALRIHKKLGNPICVWRDGKVVWIEPKDIQIPDEEDE